MTNIKCAVIEGCHWVEAACQTLQGYQLGAPILLVYNELDVPPTSTLFKSIPTRIYHFIEDTMDIKTSTLDFLKQLSTEITHDKELYFWVKWLNFFNRFWTI